MCRRPWSSCTPGDILDAEPAAECGLVRSVHEPDDLLPAARELADRWTKGRSPVGTTLARQMVYRNSALPDPADAHRIDCLSMFYMSIGDGAEGVAAFREKRNPTFRAGASADMPPFYDEWARPT